MSTTKIHERSFHRSEVEPEIDFTRALRASASTTGGLNDELPAQAID
jgi:hypothetical protein